MPAQRRMTSSSRSSFSAALAPRTRSVVTSAPALTIGLYGRWWRSSKTIELNASPLGSTPDVAQDVLAAVVVERERVGEHLGDRLQRERPVVVAARVQLAAVEGGEADREVVALLAGLLRRVVAAARVVEARDGVVLARGGARRARSVARRRCG